MRWLSSARGAFRHILTRGKRRTGSDTVARDLMIVRRGLSPAFYFFCRLFAKENGLTVVPDRREGDRRHRQRPTPTIDRRRFDRRLAENRLVKEDFLIVRDPRKGAREGKK
jgi:hypothetical protein